MKAKLLLMAVLACATPGLARAADHTVDNFVMADAVGHNIDGCGVNFSRAEDFHPAPGETTSFVFVNDYQTGLVRIDGQDVIVQVTDDKTGDAPAQARFASADGKVIVEEGYSVFQVVGPELSYVMGIVTVIIGDERQTLPVRGDVGC